MKCTITVNPLEIWNNISPETARQSVDIAYSGAIHILYLLTGRSFRPRKVMYRYTRFLTPVYV
ncbi:hypothetical protein BH20BAC1_BH20BAC1_05260 [soil metagenome]